MRLGGAVGAIFYLALKLLKSQRFERLEGLDRASLTGRAAILAAGVNRCRSVSIAALADWESRLLGGGGQSVLNGVYRRPS